MACDLWTSLRADFQDSFNTLLKEKAKEVKDELYYIIFFAYRDIILWENIDKVHFYIVWDL